MYCFECKTCTDQLKRICDEGRGRAGDTSAQKSTQQCFFLGGNDDCCSNPFICEKVDTSIREDADQACRVAFEKRRYTIRLLNVSGGLE